MSAGSADAHFAPRWCPFVKLRAFFINIQRHYMTKTIIYMTSWRLLNQHHHSGAINQSVVAY